MIRATTSRPVRFRNLCGPLATAIGYSMDHLPCVVFGSILEGGGALSIESYYRKFCALEDWTRLAGQHSDRQIGFSPHSLIPPTARRYRIWRECMGVEPTRDGYTAPQRF